MLTSCSKWAARDARLYGGNMEGEEEAWGTGVPDVDRMVELE
jgi:hypothetical protein